MQKLRQKKNLSSNPLTDQRAREEEAIRQAQAAARDQADAGTPSREEAGKFHTKSFFKTPDFPCDENVLLLPAPINRHSKISFTFLTRCETKLTKSKK